MATVLASKPGEVVVSFDTGANFPAGRDAAGFTDLVLQGTHDIVAAHVHLNASDFDWAADGSDHCQCEQDHRRRAGESGRAVEGLQQHHRIGAAEEARDQIRELEFADRQRRDDDQAGEDRMTQRRQHDVHEALPAAAAQRLRSVLEDA